MEQYLYTHKPAKNADYTVWMGFPERYEFSLSSLGYLWLYKIIDEIDDINVERICVGTEHKNNALPDLFSFSMSFDFDFLNIFSMLEKYNIPLKSVDRENPLVFAGGPVVTANPEPYKDIFDFFIIGDGEDVNKQVIEFCKNNKNLSKKELLIELANFDGVYVPYISKKVVKTTKRLENCIHTPILSDEAFFKNTFIIEVERGCANRCGFCLASYLNLPVRSVPDDELFNAINLGLKYTNKLAFLGAEVSAHPKFKEICKYIYDINNEIATSAKSLHRSAVPLPLTREAMHPRNDKKYIEMNFSSLRIDAIDENVVKTLVKAGQKNITLAIEAGSERLRKVINKNISEEQIFNAVKIASQNGLKGIKFYGMIGLPTETQYDIEALVSLAKRIKSENKGLDISFGFSSFVPKPHTPFQWYGREDTKSLEKKCKFLQKEFHKLGINVQLPSVKWDYWQTVLSRGDSNFTDFLIDVYKQGGKLGAFKSSAKKYGIDSDYYAYGYFCHVPPLPNPPPQSGEGVCNDFGTNLPWDFIKIKPGKEFLAKEYKRLLS